MPYTYNTKAKRWSECRLIHGEYPNINELRKKLLSRGYKSDYFVDFSGKTKKYTTKKKVQSGKYHFSSKINTNNYTPCLIHRKIFLEKVIQGRGGKKGSRDLLMFALYATVIWLFDKEQAQAYCKEWNDTYEEPLKDSKLWEIFGDVDRKRYRFTVKKFLDLIKKEETI